MQNGNLYITQFEIQINQFNRVIIQYNKIRGIF